MAITYHSGRRVQGNETTYTDVTTSSNGSTGNGTNNSNGFSQVTGKIGYGFSQSSGNYAINNQSWGLGNDGWSFNLWFNPQSASGNDYYLQFTETSGWRNVFYMYNAATENSGGFQPKFIDDIGTNMGLTSVALTIGSWNMITVTWTPTDDKYRVYKNGVLLYTETYTATNAGNFGTPNRNWYLGNYASQTGTLYASRANGMDEWSWWTAPLTQADITALYNGGTGIKAKDLTGANKIKLKVYYDFEDAVNGTLTNQAPTTATYTAQDTKPTNVQTGSRYEETNTRKMYHYNEPVIEYETTFSGSDSHTSDNTTVQGWLSSDASDIGVNGTGHYIDWDQSRGTNDSISYDLGTDVSSTKWILRYKIRWDAFVSNAYNEQRIGLSNLDSTNGHNASHDFIGAFHIYWTSVNRTFYGVDANGTAISADYPSSTYDSNGSESTNTWYYVSLQRLSATTFSVTYSSTDAYDGDLFQSSAYTCDATNVGHRYIYMTCENAGSGDAGMNSHISDIKFYNGVSSTDELGWKEEGT